ncbi:saccharopine dehydrogenase NADP-binding domain-containing protein [Marinicella sp. S1101]|uniref:saccharopine dehydrogenase family protein n=1 Tax=Marinicella marina TaxID=2996016 RepID=UPI0022610250|nr:saccharopine dehydrogenase C-terminal domain-containing protein [Marinicella marina]MCX7552399.1 saccharopine dehydrogenase NADP-binding domain-containing protein [Marinicella marina]MDJ1139274.1 saccharopine dehydrogenase C-terminal domain-containing protein [Marinicella marina]
MKKVLVLGGGRIGAAIAKNLSADHAVTLADLSIDHLDYLHSDCQLVAADACDDESLKNLVQPFDVVVGALPSLLGFDRLKALIELNKMIVDISFFAEDALALNELAKTNGVTALVDFGLAPGISNLYAGHFVQQFDQVDAFACKVGGVPVERLKPFEYKAPFAPLDVIEEYTRPARMRREGKEIILPAMSEIESLYFKGVGHMEAFNTDGLRSLLQTVNIPTMAEKTVRYNGHATLIQQLIDAGFFKPEHRDATAKVLLEQWQFDENEPDLTVMEISASGVKNGKPHAETYQLIDHYDQQNNVSSMARTTGYTCAAGVRLALNNELPKGVLPPEIIGQNPSWFAHIMSELATHNINIKAV